MRTVRIIIVATLLLTAMAVTPASASASGQDQLLAQSGQGQVGDSAPPLLSVGDVDGSGVVDDVDVDLVRQAVRGGVYGSLYDRNGDHRLTNEDVRIVRRERGLESTAFDRQLVAIYHRFAWTQTDAWQPIADTLLKFGPVKGEGSVRLTDDGLDSLINFKTPALDTLEVVIGPEDGTPWGLRFYSTGVPAFDDPRAFDFPFLGGAWEGARVTGFLNQPPQVTVSPDERWAQAVGQCWAQLGTEQNGRTESGTIYNDCQTWPNDYKISNINLWLNNYVMTMWIYQLNPLGLFAPVHPDLEGLDAQLDRDAPETVIDAGPSATSEQDEATLVFSGFEYNGQNGRDMVSSAYGVSRLECQLDGAGFSACVSPLDLTDLANGPHTFDVRAVDFAGNVDESPASYTWTVAAPFATCGGYGVVQTEPGVFTAPGFTGNLIVGTDGRDRLVGTNGPDLILGLAGKDVIFAKNGDDVVCGGAGRDVIVGGSGTDYLDGGERRDLLVGNSGNDTINGGDGRDVLFGGQGNDQLDGGPESDRCRGGSGDDTISNCER